MRRRVVVTGLGVVSPLGCNVRKAWEKVVSGGHGICKLQGANYEKLPCRVAAPVRRGTGPDDLDTSGYLAKSDERTMAPATVFGLVAGIDALNDAGWKPKETLERQRTGVCIGMGMVDLDHICSMGEALHKSYSRVSPFFVPRILPNMAAGHVSMKFGFQGPNHTVSTACATGSHAIGDAFRFIVNNDADVMVAGGAEACISPLSIAGFCRIRALSTAYNDIPEKSSRPFDKKRDGFVMGEGAAILVLEELNHALKRNAKIYAEILGYGLSADASHITAPHEGGAGAFLAMTRSVAQAQLKPTDITYVNAHATSTPLGDAIELKSITNLFGPHLPNVSVSSTKGAHGHLLGAAGNLESLFTVLACHHGVLPPTINLDEICDEGKSINCVPNVKQEWKAPYRVALKNSFGFGGTNACLCIAEYKE